MQSGMRSSTTFGMKKKDTKHRWQDEDEESEDGEDAELQQAHC